MEALVFLILGGLAVFVVFTIKNKEVEELSLEAQNDPVAKFIHFKKRILVTSAYDQSSTYELLYGKVAQLLSRHLDIELFVAYLVVVAWTRSTQEHCL